MFALDLEDQPYLLACSGGGDSLALAHLLREQKYAFEVAYLDHGQGSSAQPFLEQLCAQWKVRFWWRRLHVQAWARRYGMSWEAAGRELRYAWLRRLAAGRGAQLLTAHTADDQAETVLLRILQGTTLSGLSAIEPAGRPLLGLRRTQLREYLRQSGQVWLEDPANEEPRFTRVALRQRIMPLLEELNSGVVGHLLALAQDAGELRRILACEKPLREMNRLEFEEWLHRSWRSLVPSPARWQREHARGIWQLIQGQDWGCLNLPGQSWAEWDGQRLALGLDDYPLPGPQWRYRQAGDTWKGRPLKECMRTWGMPRRLRDVVPLRAQGQEVLEIPGWTDGGVRAIVER